MNEGRVRRGVARLRKLRRPGVRRSRTIPVGRLLPNVLTMLGLCAGLTAIRLGIEARYADAAVAITVAGAIDGVDGRLARLLRATSRFGAEFDSLSDFLSFGVAPAFVLWSWSLTRAGGYGFVPCLLFVVCMALRLARFNAAIERPSPLGPRFSLGLPAPAGAGLALFPLFVGLEARTMGWSQIEAALRHPALPAVVLIATAGLLVSTLPVWSGKAMRLSRAAVLPVLLGSLLFAAFLIADPWAALALAGIVYAAGLPIARRAAIREANGRGVAK